MATIPVPQPAETTQIIDPADTLEGLNTFGIEVVVGLGLVAVIISLLVFALLRAGRFPPAVGLIIALSILSFLAMAGFAATQQETFGTIAATAVGALAGAVSAVWTDRSGTMAVVGQPLPKEKPMSNDDQNVISTELQTKAEQAAQAQKAAAQNADETTMPSEADHETVAVEPAHDGYDADGDQYDDTPDLVTHDEGEDVSEQEDAGEFDPKSS